MEVIPKQMDPPDEQVELGGSTIFPGQCGEKRCQREDERPEEGLGTPRRRMDAAMQRAGQHRRDVSVRFSRYSGAPELSCASPWRGGGDRHGHGSRDSV